MTVEIPTTGGRIEARLRPIDHPARLLSVELGKLGHVVHVLPAMLKDGISDCGVHTRRTGHHRVFRDHASGQPATCEVERATCQVGAPARKRSEAA